MSRSTPLLRTAAFTACFVLCSSVAMAQGSSSFLGASGGRGGAAAAAAAMGAGGAEVDPTGLGMDMGGAGMQGLGGQAGANGLSRTTGRAGLPSGLSLPGGARPTDFSDPALQSALMRPLPPLEPNDFQKFIQTGTGRMLPVFGSNLFEEAPGNFAPVGAVPVPADYVIGPGDEILLRSTGVLDFEMRPVVDRDGQIVLPKVGAVQVAGVRMADL